MLPVTRLINVSSLLLILAGCSTSGVSPEVENYQPPAYWNQSEQPVNDFAGNWLDTLPGEQLAGLVDDALNENFRWKVAQARLEQSRASVISSGADRYPSLSLNASGGRRQNVVNEVASISESYSIGLNLNWELDIWGKLSDQQKAARLSYEASRADLLDTRRQLVANVASAWYRLIEAKQLLTLYEKRLQSLKQSQDVLERGYRQGLNEALDVYLGRNTLASQESQIASQRQTVVEAATELERLLGRYPDGRWPLEAELPVLGDVIPVGTPSSLLTRRADVLESWLNLMSADASLAVAHKRRFPSLSLSASVSDSASAVDELLNGGPAAWSLLGSLAQPLFQGGQLKANEDASRARVTELEQNYLDTLFSAFEEVEVAVSKESALKDRYQALQTAEESARISYELSTEQYQRGLVEYTTLLESQRRAFDASASLVQLQGQMLQNRISLYLALGGSFDAAERITE